MRRIDRPRTGPLRSAIHNFLGTYLSRNSDVGGYWLWGRLVHELGPSWQVDLLRACAKTGIQGIAAEMARRKCGEQLRKHGIEPAALSSASLGVVVGNPAMADSGGYRRDGHEVMVSVDVVSVHGACFTETRAFFVAPHDPSIERKSTR